MSIKGLTKQIQLVESILLSFHLNVFMFVISKKSIDMWQIGKYNYVGRLRATSGMHLEN